MRKITAALAVIFLCIVSPFSLHAKAASITPINDLIENAKELDGKVVTVQGEAIGECMNRGSNCWININDTTNAIGIWVEKSNARKVKYYGNYKTVGDTVEITGTFHRACSEHGGEADIHGKLLKVIKPGCRVHEKISVVKIVCTVILIVITAIVFIIFKKKVMSKWL